MRLSSILIGGTALSVADGFVSNGLLATSKGALGAQVYGRSVLHQVPSSPFATGKSTTVLNAEMTDEEFAQDQALIARVAMEVQEETGVELEQLINPFKVVNLERDLVKLRAALEDGPSTARREEIEAEIAKKEQLLATEKRSYMQQWLKRVFVGQAIFTTILGGFMVYDALPFFSDLDISIRVLGFWLIWLFTVPSLRARKPGGEEKEALNIAFLATPVTNLAAPFFTKDPVLIYWANIAVLALSYGYGFTVGSPGVGGELSSDKDKNRPQWLKFLYKAVDFGSGQERG
ncbi:unnamed protein product, partial [Choristocarpus tenellus]